MEPYRRPNAEVGPGSPTSAASAASAPSARARLTPVINATGVFGYTSPSTAPLAAAERAAKRRAEIQQEWLVTVGTGGHVVPTAAAFAGRE